MSNAEHAIARSQALLMATTLAVRASLTPAQLADREALLVVRPSPSEPCPVCLDVTGVRCCEFGASG